MTLGLKRNDSIKVCANEKARRVATWLAALYTTALLAAVTFPRLSLADDEHKLTELFETTAFAGSWEVFSKFDWLGNALNFLISTFCLFGLVLVVVRFTLTILYKSNENIFDRVYELKQTGKGQNFAGIPSMFKEVFNGNYGTGFDVLLGFGLSLCPNVKQYSDYNPEKMAFNLKEDDTVTTYVLKMSLPTIMTIFFFSLGFNGTLWKAYGNVVDAMAVAAENVCDVKLAQIVDNAMNTSLYYQFNFKDGTNFGSVLQDAAKKTYSRLLMKTVTDQDPSVYKDLGSQIETRFKEDIKGKISDITKDVEANAGSSIISFVAADGKVEDSKIKLLNIGVNVNQNPEGADSEKDGVYHLCWKVTNENNKASIVGATGSESSGDAWFIHLTLTRDADDRPNYFGLGQKNSVRGPQNPEIPSSSDEKKNEGTEENKPS